MRVLVLVGEYGRRADPASMPIRLVSAPMLPFWLCSYLRSPVEARVAGQGSGKLQGWITLCLLDRRGDPPSAIADEAAYEMTMPLPMRAYGPPGRLRSRIKRRRRGTRMR